SLADYQANLAALRQKISTITPQMTFAGFVPLPTADDKQAQITPVTLQLTINDHGQITADVHYTLYRANARFTGTLRQLIDGPNLTLKLSDIPNAQQNARIPGALLRHKLGKPQWSMSLADTGPIL